MFPDANTQSNLKVREAGPEDAELVLAFILELATYEHIRSETSPNIEALQRDLQQTADPRLHCLIAELGGSVAGMAAYYLAYSTNRTKWNIHLQDIFINESHRNLGIGKALMKRLGEIARAKDCGAIEFEVFKWNTNARTFYESLGAVPEEGVLKMYIEGDALRKL